MNKNALNCLYTCSCVLFYAVNLGNLFFGKPPINTSNYTLLIIF